MRGFTVNRRTGKVLERGKDTERAQTIEVVLEWPIKAYTIALKKGTTDNNIGARYEALQNKVQSALNDLPRNRDKSTRNHTKGPHIQELQDLLLSKRDENKSLFRDITGLEGWVREVIKKFGAGGDITKWKVRAVGELMKLRERQTLEVRQKYRGTFTYLFDLIADIADQVGVNALARARAIVAHALNTAQAQEKVRANAVNMAQAQEKVRAIVTKAVTNALQKEKDALNTAQAQEKVRAIIQNAVNTANARERAKAIYAQAVAKALRKEAQHAARTTTRQRAVNEWNDGNTARDKRNAAWDAKLLVNRERIIRERARKVERSRLNGESTKRRGWGSSFLSGAGRVMTSVPKSTKSPSKNLAPWQYQPDQPDIWPMTRAVYTVKRKTKPPTLALPNYSQPLALPNYSKKNRKAYGPVQPLYLPPAAPMKYLPPASAATKTRYGGAAGAAAALPAFLLGKYLWNKVKGRRGQTNSSSSGTSSGFNSGTSSGNTSGSTSSRKRGYSKTNRDISKQRTLAAKLRSESF